MWTLKKPEVTDYREHLDIAFPTGALPETISEADKDALLLYYELYVESAGRPSVDLKGEEVSPELRSSLHDAYDFVQDGRRLAKLRSAIKLLAELCPYCGFGQVDELDHVLQRAHFKLFSIFALNLVPCCGPCNGGKRRIPSNNPSEHQVHAYLEDVTGFDFMRADAKVDVVSGALLVDFSVIQSEGMDDDLFSRLRHHLVEFNLQERYQKQVNIFLGELQYSITSSFETNGAEGLKAFLEGSAKTLKKRFGKNDWRAALMAGLAHCEAFCSGAFAGALGFKVAAAEVQEQD